MSSTAEGRAVAAREGGGRERNTYTAYLDGNQPHISEVFFSDIARDKRDRAGWKKVMELMTNNLKVAHTTTTGDL
jgi:hypothetical protein